MYYNTFFTHTYSVCIDLTFESYLECTIGSVHTYVVDNTECKQQGAQPAPTNNTANYVYLKFNLVHNDGIHDQLIS